MKAFCSPFRLQFFGEGVKMVWVVVLPENHPEKIARAATSRTSRFKIRDNCSIRAGKAVLLPRDFDGDSSAHTMRSDEDSLRRLVRKCFPFLYAERILMLLRGADVTEEDGHLRGGDKRE